MTREEAIEVVKAYRDKVIHSVSNQLDGDIEALDMAIQALSQEPTETPGELMDDTTKEIRILTLCKKLGVKLFGR